MATKEKTKIVFAQQFVRNQNNLEMGKLGDITHTPTPQDTLLQSFKPVSFCFFFFDICRSRGNACYVDIKPSE
jgi:hypothetical protein